MSPPGRSRLRGEEAGAGGEGAGQAEGGDQYRQRDPHLHEPARGPGGYYGRGGQLTAVLRIEV